MNNTIIKVGSKITHDLRDATVVSVFYGGLIWFTYDDENTFNDTAVKTRHSCLARYLKD